MLGQGPATYLDPYARLPSNAQLYHMSVDDDPGSETPERETSSSYR
jgi:hypothetical protein